jgi:diguanylate cyclase (GGDEF)-like protein
MTESVLPQEVQEGWQFPRVTGRQVGVFAAQTLGILVAAGVMAWLLRLLIGSFDESAAAWWWQVMLTLAALLASTLITIRQYRRWRYPFDRLHELLPQVRAGEAPIEALSQIGGGLEPLIPILQELCRDNRQKQAIINELNEEMRQRVAQRTDKLERKIGTLKHQASIDPLTGLLNRRAMEEMLPRLIERQKADGGKCCLLAIDVDNFKLLNDTLGHPAGDDFLRSLGQMTRSSIRPSDLAFRVGGDEIIILLPDATREVGQAMAKRLETLVEAMGRTLKVSPPPRLSVGVATLEEVPEATAASVLAEADRRLYAEKATRRGRNG